MKKPKLPPQRVKNIMNRIDSRRPHGCWPSDYTPSQPYARVMVNGQSWLLHRLMVYIHRPDDRERLLKGDPVLHQCDNSRCCNPLHLVVGTQWQNIRERDLRHGYRPGLKLK